MEKIYIGNELFLVENPEHFAQILENKLGAEASDLFRSYASDTGFNEEDCSGDCDRVGDLLSDAQDALNSLEEIDENSLSELNRVNLRQAKRILRWMS